MQISIALLTASLLAFEPGAVASTPPAPAVDTATASAETPKLKLRDTKSEERVRRGRVTMIRSGVAMSSGALLILSGAVATIAVGRAPLPRDYEDIGSYQDDYTKYARKTIAGSLMSGIGSLVTIGASIAFVVGALQYRRGRKALEQQGKRVVFEPAAHGLQMRF